MSAIYDISGTTSDSFIINGKATFLQGDVNPLNKQGVDGDVYLQSGVEGDPSQIATLWIKRNGSWKDMGNSMLPVSEPSNAGMFLYSTGDGNYDFADVKFDGDSLVRTVDAGDEGNVISGNMASSDMFRIRIGGPANNGWTEIANGITGNEPIYVRQYKKTGNTLTVQNELVLLDGSGNTYLAQIPGASNATDSKQVPTIGWVNDPTKSTNVVHRTGNESIAGVKTFSSTITSSKSTSTYLNGNKGNTIINSTANAGTYTMLAKMNTTNGFMTTGTYQGKYLLQYTTTEKVEAEENGVTYAVTLLNEDGYTILAKNPEATNSQSTTQAATLGWVNNPSLSTNVVHRSGDETIAGNKTFSSTIKGTALKAMWADLAEYYEADNDYPAGTLMTFGGEKEVTIATEDCNAVVSTNPAVIMNGNQSFEHPCPIALVGRVPVRVIGKVNKFDYLQLSEIAGVARAIPDEDFNFSNVIARALENKESEEEGLVLCVVKFEL